MTHRINAAEIATGVGPAHSKGCLACADANLLAVCGADPARLQERGDALGIPRERHSPH